MQQSRSSRKKGQAFSTEFLLAYLIFSLVLVLAFYLWNTTTADIIESKNRYEIEDKAVESAEKLLRTRGIPADWSVGDVESIGLASESRILDSGKVLDFVILMNSSNSNYENNKWLLGIGKYDFYFNLTYINGSTMSINDTLCSAGRKAVNETSMITVRRTGLINNEIAIIILTLWYGESSITAAPWTTSTVTTTTSTTSTTSTSTTSTSTTSTTSTTTSTTSTTTTSTSTTTTILTCGSIENCLDCIGNGCQWCEHWIPLVTGCSDSCKSGFLGNCWFGDCHKVSCP